MTTSASIPIEVYGGNDSATSFPFSHYFAADTEIVLVHETLAGVLSSPVLDIDYTVVGAGTATGSVTFPKAGSTYNTLATGEKLALVRVTTQSQTPDLAGSYFFSTLNSNEDKQMRIIQELQEQLNRCAKYKKTNTDTPPYLEDIETVTETDQTKVISFNIVASNVSVSTGDSLSFKGIAAAFNGWSVVAVRAYNFVKGVTGTTDVLLKKKKISDDTIVNVLSTAITVGDERTAADGIIDTSNNTLATGDILYPNISTIHSGTAPLGIDIDVTIQAP
jgi:hypothetical protein